MLKAASDALTGAVRVVGVNGIGWVGRQDERALTTRLSAGLPGVSADDISRHETWHRQKGLFIAKKRVEKEVRRRGGEAVLSSINQPSLVLVRIPCAVRVC